ncbi:MAG: hypothetical protein WCD81_01145 [Candidatus Bathyarchaeia archaeon]
MKYGKAALATLILFALLVQGASFMLVAKAQPTAEQFSIINPGPSSYPSRWNASSTVRDYNTSNFIFYSNETSFDSTFFMNVTVTNVTNLFGWGIGIVYDNTTLQFVRAWLPTDHVFTGAVDAGASVVAPSPVVAPVDATHQEIEYGASYTPPTPPWSFNGTGTLAQVEFQIIAEVNSTNTQVSSSFTFDPVWTAVYFWPSGTEVPTSNTGNFVYAFPVTAPTPTIAALAISPSSIIDSSLVPTSTFSVNVTISNATDLNRWSMSIYYNNTMLGVANSVEGSFMNSVGTTTFASNTTQDFNATNGKLMLSCNFTSGSVGASGKGTIATITFQVLANGSTPIVMADIQMTDSFGRSISYTQANGFFSNIPTTTIHEVVVTDITVSSYFSSTWVYQGRDVNINVTVSDSGGFPENATVTLYYNITAGEIAGVQSVTLISGENETLLFVWNTTGVPISYDNYTLTAVARIPTGSNTLSDGTMQVRILGDLDGNGKVDMADVIVFEDAFGSYPTHPRWNPAADVNENGIVYLNDLATLLMHWGQTS